MRRSSMNTRSPDTRSQPGAAAAAARAVSGSGSKPRSSARRTRRRTRRGSSANARGEAMRRRRAARSAEPSEGIDRSARHRRCGSAIALTVKSRSARSADSEPPRSGWMSTCQERSRATTRQPQKSSDSSKQAAPPAARAIARAAVAGLPSSTTSRSSVSRPEHMVARGAADQPCAGVGQRDANGAQRLRHARRPRSRNASRRRTRAVCASRRARTGRR